jgi:phosphoglucosamine mutase
VLRELGAEVIVYGNQPNGMNINQDCGSMHPEAMCRKVVKHKAHLGIAHDGDADRVLLCDEKGNLIDGDDIMAIAALDMLAQKTLAEKTLVATVMSNAGLEAAIKSAGGKVIRTAVGDRNVVDEMLRHGFNFGGEQSGHLIFRDFGTTGDGLVAALQMLRIVKARQTPLSKLAKCWARFPQLITNVRVREKIPFAQLDGVLKLVKQAEMELKSAGGRVLLRYSGTEPKARLLLEGHDAKILEKWSEKICAAIQKQIGA